MDRIFIRDLNLAAIIGTLPHERKFRQNITLNIELCYDMSEPCRSDNLFDAVDYSAVERDIIEKVENSSFQLLEALAQSIADLCLSYTPVRKVKVRIDKPAAAVRARAIALEIERKKTPSKPSPAAD